MSLGPLASSELLWRERSETEAKGTTREGFPMTLGPRILLWGSGGKVPPLSPPSFPSLSRVHTALCLRTGRLGTIQTKPPGKEWPPPDRCQQE